MNLNPSLIILIVGIVILVVLFIVLTILIAINATRNVSYFNFRVSASKIAPQSLSTLSKNGPYIDTHFKDMTSTDPIGQTYYQRPVTSYDKDKKLLKIKLSGNQPTIHMNSNSVSTDVRYNGLITISDFTYGKYNADSLVTVNVSLYNGTGHDLIGFHVHDGETVPTGATCTDNNKKVSYSGYTNFGPIAYFIHTTDYWINNATKLSKQGTFPLPLKDAIAQTKFPLTT